MHCYLTISGRKFDPDDFLKKSRLAFLAEVWRCGEPLMSKTAQKALRRKTRPDSGFQVAASKAGNDHRIDSQVRQVIRFMKAHRRDLKRLANSGLVEWRSMRFGIIWPKNTLALGRVLPVELLRLAALFRIEIEFSVHGATAWKPSKRLAKKMHLVS